VLLPLLLLLGWFLMLSCRFAVSTAGSLMPELFQRRQSEYGARQVCQGSHPLQHVTFCL